MKVIAEDVADWTERRLEELRRELAAGEAQLAELDRRRVGIRETLLRISGAIQVLEELTAAEMSTASEAGSTNGRHDG